MRAMIFVVAVPALAALVSCASGPAVGSAAPAFSARDAQGDLVSLEGLKGKVVVLDFWATWCAPCRRASPHVQALHERFADDDGVVVLGVHYDGSGDPAAYMAEHGYTYGLIPDGSDVAGAFGIRGIPTFMVLDPEGTVVHKQAGFSEPEDVASLAEVVQRSRALDPRPARGAAASAAPEA